MLLLKICILFSKFSIKTGKYLFDCSGKVSLSQIRRGVSINCGVFSEYGIVFNEAGSYGG